jgi:hypothetical protein
MRLIKNAIALVAAACSLLGVHTSEAQVTLTFAQVGPDVTATWSGSYLLPAGGTTSPFTEFTHLGPQIALGSGGGTAAIVSGAGIQTPTSLVATDGFTYTGEIFGFDGTTLFFPAGAAGTYSPSGTMTFANTTLAALGASDFNNTLAFTGTGNTGGDREIRLHTAKAMSPVTLTFAQVGPDVTATWSGSFALPNDSEVVFSATVFSLVDAFTAVGRGVSFGNFARSMEGFGVPTPSGLVQTTGTYVGDLFGYSNTRLEFPVGATGVFSPSGTMTFANTTLAALGAADFNNTLAFTGTGNTGGDREIRLHTATIALPTLTSVSPNTGTTAGGTAVTLTGTNFTGATNVTFGGTAATNMVVVNPTTITCTTPAGTAGAKSVLVTTPGGTNAANTLFTYVAPPSPPTLTSVSPNSGSTAGGTSVTLTGTGFTGATNVTFGGTAATNRVVVNATTITCTTPAGTAGAKSVLVTTPGGTNAANTLFTYVAPSGMLVFNFVESGGTVTMTYSGTLDTNGMTPQPDPPHQHNGTFIFDIPERDIIGIAGTNANTNSYLWTTTPLNFIVREAGQGFVFFTPNPGSTPFMNSARNAAGVSLESADIDANGIWSGSGGATLNGPDFATLGLVPGRHSYTDAVSGQSVIFNIGDVPEPPLPPFVITSYSRNPATGESTLVWDSVEGKSYFVLGGGDLEELTDLHVDEIPGTGEPIEFKHTPPGNPDRYFYSVEER